DRDRLLSQSRFAVERLTRELRSALPNSVRTHISASQQCVEFTPVLVATRYASLPLFTAEPELQLFGLSNQWADMASKELGYGTEGLRVYVYATTKSQIYQSAETNPGVFFALDSSTPTPDPYDITANASGYDIRLKFASSALFSNASPSKRLYIVRQPIAYCALATGQLIRHSQYGFSAGTPAFGTGVLMAEGVNFSKSSFRVDDAVLSRNSVVHVVLAFVSAFGDDLFFNQEVHVPNVP
ncbi:MAG: hypothetical protein K2W88_18460, partial [Pararheinheimera sp.]|nr:hypothetical protein [Rheinheimera sp.]